jgi:uncharacterized phage protein (TIGR02218 family)
MKVLTTAIQNMITSNALTLATCWRVQLLNGTVYRFTDHDRDLVVASETYDAESGFRRSAVAADATLAVPNLQIIGFVDQINKADLDRGLWDFAEVRVFLVNYLDPDSGIIALRRGWIGEVIVDDTGEYQAELRGLAQVLTNNVGELYSPECRAQLGDDRCRVDLTAFTFPCHAGTGSTKSALIHTGLTQADGYFDTGTIVGTSGLNNGVKREVLYWLGGTLVPFLNFPYDVTVGDTFNAVAGCNKTTNTCINKFNNILNFRGEPFVPGADALLDYAIPGNKTG